MSKKTAIHVLLGAVIAAIVALAVMFPLNVKAATDATPAPVGKRVEWKAQTTPGLNHILLLPAPCADPVLQGHVTTAVARLPEGHAPVVARAAETLIEGDLTAACWLVSPLNGQVLLVRSDGLWMITGLTEDVFEEESI
jgi:hypothetical protein